MCRTLMPPLLCGAEWPCFEVVLPKTCAKVAGLRNIDRFDADILREALRSSEHERDADEEAPDEYQQKPGCLLLSGSHLEHGSRSILRYWQYHLGNLRVHGTTHAQHVGSETWEVSKDQPTERLE